MEITRFDSRVIVALDFPQERSARTFVDRLDPTKCKLKVGLEMYTAFGAPFVQQLVRQGFDVFLDLKFHDIPNTVAGACRKAAELGVWMTNIHGLGGFAMMTAAKKAVDEVGSQTKLIAVTILTSHSQEDLGRVGLAQSINEQVKTLAQLSRDAGLDGIVCSAQETSSLKQTLPEHFIYVTPGIRPEWAASNDQQRIVTPVQALRNGASYLVIGRPITQANDPMDALKRVQQSIAAAFPAKV